VYPIGAISLGQKGQQLAEFGELVGAGAVAVSDDGKPVVSSHLMRTALEYARTFGIPVADHCEDPTLAWMLSLTPANAPWLMAKVVGLVAYVALGVIAMRPTRSRRVRVAAWLAAMATAGWIVSVAITKSAWGVFSLMA
jgi:dihydroorotase-like cyclic amidohydrolase